MKKQAYHGGSFWGSIGADFKNIDIRKQVVNADVLDAPFKPTPKIQQVIKSDLDWLIRTSPPTRSEGLISKISKCRNIPKENILVSGGSSDIMFSFFTNFLNKNAIKNRVLILDPMYGEYQHIFEVVMGIRPYRHKLKEGIGFMVDVSFLREDIKKFKPNMVVLVNPNSPTGKYLDSRYIEALVREFPDACFVVDETYIDYLGKGYSLETKVREYENLVIIKSMSKVYALSGARVAYLAAPVSIINKISPYIAPWSVGIFGQIAGSIALEEENYYKNEYEKVLEYKKKMLSSLQELDQSGKIKIFDSCANFFLIKLEKKSASEVVSRLATKNIFIRNCDSMSNQFKDNFIRIAVKDQKSNKIVLKEFIKLVK